MTVAAGVTGWPIAHSLSPAIHGAWIVAAGLDATYEAFPAEDEAAFAALVARGRAGMIRGLNVTAPWKDKALACADEATPTARAAGSANLLLFHGGKVWVDSTDGQGLLAALSAQAAGLGLDGARVTILGAGGAARAAAAAMKAVGADVGVMNRGVERAQALATELGVRVQGADDLRDADLVVNALPVDPGIDPAVFRAGAVIMDMTYRPLLTPLLAAARARGLTVVDGLAMLIGQARPSFRALFGVAPPVLDVRALCLKAMEAAS